VVLLLKVISDLPKSVPKGYRVKPVTNILVDLKYGDRDITSGSLEFRSSKGYETSGGPLPEHIYTPKL
jgi:hypothetical protein